VSWWSTPSNFRARAYDHEKPWTPYASPKHALSSAHSNLDHNVIDERCMSQTIGACHSPHLGRIKRLGY
jgi:hypothetical protein